MKDINKLVADIRNAFLNGESDKLIKEMIIEFNKLEEEVYLVVYVYPDLLDRIDKFFEGKEGHRSNPKFLKLAERIAGKRCVMKMRGDEAFEVEDDNYWIPRCCYDMTDVKALIEDNERNSK